MNEIRRKRNHIGKYLDLLTTTPIYSEDESTIKNFFIQHPDSYTEILHPLFEKSPKEFLNIPKDFSEFVTLENVTKTVNWIFVDEVPEAGLVDEVTVDEVAHGFKVSIKMESKVSLRYIELLYLVRSNISYETFIYTNYSTEMNILERVANEIENYYLDSRPDYSEREHIVLKQKVSKRPEDVLSFLVKLKKLKGKLCYIAESYKIIVTALIQKKAEEEEKSDRITAASKEAFASAMKPYILTMEDADAKGKEYLTKLGKNSVVIPVRNIVSKLKAGDYFTVYMKDIDKNVRTNEDWKLVPPIERGTDIPGYIYQDIYEFKEFNQDESDLLKNGNAPYCMSSNMHVAFDKGLFLKVLAMYPEYTEAANNTLEVLDSEDYLSFESDKPVEVVAPTVDPANIKELVAEIERQQAEAKEKKEEDKREKTTDYHVSMVDFLADTLKIRIKDNPTENVPIVTMSGLPYTESIKNTVKNYIENHKEYRPDTPLIVPVYRANGSIITTILF